MTKHEKQTKMLQAIEAQKIEREKNLRLMFSKGQISKEEFDQKINKS